LEHDTLHLPLQLVQALSEDIPLKLTPDPLHEWHVTDFVPLQTRHCFGALLLEELSE
jgi:hypothetical protein